MIFNRLSDQGLKLELHADDLGATISVNRGIMIAWEKGGVDGASVLANGDALDAAAAEVNRHPERRLRLVAHLNLSEARCVATDSDVHLLINRDGHLQWGFLGLWLLWTRSNASARQHLLDQITIEWRAQISKIQRAFAPRNIDALDGHIHIHMLPFTFPIAVNLAKEFGIGQIRISRELRHFSLRDSFRFGCLANVVKHQLLRILAGPARKLAAETGLSSPDAVAGLLYSGRMSKTAIATAASASRRNGHGWLEVICHPGRATPEEQLQWVGKSGPGGFFLSADRDFERQTLIELGEARSSSQS